MPGSLPPFSLASSLGAFRWLLAQTQGTVSICDEQQKTVSVRTKWNESGFLKNIDGLQCPGTKTFGQYFFKLRLRRTEQDRKDEKDYMERLYGEHRAYEAKKSANNSWFQDIRIKMYKESWRHGVGGAYPLWSRRLEPIRPIAPPARNRLPTFLSLFLVHSNNYRSLDVRLGRIGSTGVIEMISVLNIEIDEGIPEGAEAESVPVGREDDR
ncbi:hypothetical protein BDP27DRAFT_1369612 [Rhodocollybia butyracea]|uniref:LAGLIDADG homing endonuclease n=1 Tax=Rhodocollybia butyracea TaxID=206335 RepID=A0A9P5TZF3_9AGAR|nr:hypothetical protein BDP27DRAFT_1369612 [Rhodocollybia butyracea]